MDPATLLNAELEALLQRLMQIEASKWSALKQLGLMPVPSAKGGNAA